MPLPQAPTAYPHCTALPYPAVCLLIASVHASTSGHDTFTFEMLHDAFKTQVRTSQSAPVQVAGGGVGMVRCSRELLFSVRPPFPYATSLPRPRVRSEEAQRWGREK